jgi:hypothetical protein
MQERRKEEENRKENRLEISKMSRHNCDSHRKRSRRRRNRKTNGNGKEYWKIQDDLMYGMTTEQR